MSDRKHGRNRMTLESALETWRRHADKGTKPPKYTMGVIVNAARRVLEGEQVPWCEEHGYVVKDPQSTACLLKALSPATTGITDLAPCSIVPKLLVEGVGDE